MDLDKPLDDIIAQNRRSRNAVRKRKVIKKKPRTSEAKTKNSTPAAKEAQTKAIQQAIVPKTNKVIVSNLPLDVGEREIKEFFQAKVAPVRRVDVTYNAVGKSKGISTIVFNNTAAAEKAMQFNGSKIDGVPLRIEYVVNLVKSASLLSRVQANPQIVTKAISGATSQKKKRTTPKSAPNGSTAVNRANPPQAKNKGRNMKAKKSAAELDQEMSDYFTNKQS